MSLIEISAAAVWFLCATKLISAWILSVYKDCWSLKIYTLINLHGSEFLYHICKWSSQLSNTIYIYIYIWKGNYVFWKLYNYKQIVCPLEGDQRAEPLHVNVRVRLIEGFFSGSGRYTSRGISNGVPVICIPPIHIIILYIPGDCVHGGWLWLGSGDFEN